MSVYLYAIMKWPLRQTRSRRAADAGTSWGTGVGDPPQPVRFIEKGNLAAVVSDADPTDLGSSHGVRGLRRDMKAHSAVLNRLTERGATVLPVQFGVLLPDEEAVVSRLLVSQARALAALLRHVEGAVEVTLKATYVEDRALREVVDESPAVARLAAATRGRAASRDAYQTKIELGKRVAEALRAKKAREASWLLKSLSPAVRDARVKESPSETIVLQASFLVERDRLPTFDKRLAAISAETRGRLLFDCVGPLPPYSFADLRL